MKIINPLYDRAFKYLMENDKFAKKVLSVILDTEVVALSLAQQETVLPDEKRGLSLFRLDFKADIKESDGSQKTVLIELQKSKYITDIHRFRSYLGMNYVSKPKENKKQLKKKKTPEYHTTYPIITIYILGYNLEDLPYMAVTVNRAVENSVTKEKLNVKCFFIEHLTHTSHIIQVRRLPEKRRTKLEQFLTLFNQNWTSLEADYILDLEETPNDFSDIVEYLRGPVMDEEFRRNLAAEEELDLIFDEQEAKYMQQIAEEKKRREKAEKEKEALAIKLAKQMKKIGASVEEIAKETGLSQKTIRKL